MMVVLRKGTLHGSYCTTPSVVTACHVLVLLALIIYFVVSWARSPERAKEVLIKFFTVLNSILSIFFLLATAYAFFEGNQPVLELTLSFLVVTVLALAITRICRWRFVKNHPHYMDKSQRVTFL